MTPTPATTTAASRRIVVRSADTLIVNGYELDGEILKELLNPDNRVLWAFIKQDTRIQPVAYDESRVMWLTDEDLTPENEIK